LICITAYAIITINYNRKYPSEQSPIRTLTVQVEKNQREQLISELRSFSQKNDFKFYLSYVKGTEVFFIDIEGEGLEILALSDETPNLNIRFFDKDPSNPPSQETVNDLSNDLKSYIQEIPDAIVTEEK
jgi:hypothetical protein